MQVVARLIYLSVLNLDCNYVPGESDTTWNLGALVTNHRTCHKCQAYMTPQFRGSCVAVECRLATVMILATGAAAAAGVALAALHLIVGGTAGTACWTPA